MIGKDIMDKFYLSYNCQWLSVNNLIIGITAEYEDADDHPVLFEYAMSVEKRINNIIYNFYAELEAQSQP